MNTHRKGKVWVFVVGVMVLGLILAGYLVVTETGLLEGRAATALIEVGMRDDVLVVEIEPRHGVVRFRLLRLLFETDDDTVLVELGYAVGGWVAHVVPEDSCAVGLLRALLEHALKPVSVEDVVAEHERARVAGDELLADQEGLGETVRARLDCILEPEAPTLSVAEETLKQ